MFPNKFFRATAVATSVLLVTSGCATTGNDGSGAPRTALDRSINQCIGTVVGGALLGALLGGVARPRGGAATGAAIGAGAGAVACAVIIAMNNQQDRERIRQSQINALNANASDTSQYVGSDGQSRTVRTTIQPAAMPTVMAGASGPAIVGPCRRAQTQITVQGKGTANLDAEVVCRTAAGDWVPAPPARTA